MDEDLSDSLSRLVEIATKLPDDILDHPEFTHVYHSVELLLSYNLIQWLATYHHIEINSNDWTKLHDQLSLLCNKQNDLIQYCQKVLEVIPSQYQIRITLNLSNQFEDPYGEWLQNSLHFEDRKTLASNYTANADKIFSQINLPLNIKSLADYFCGSGNLIIAYLDKYHQKLTAQNQLLIRINDLMPTAVLLAFCRIIALGHDHNIHATIQNGFAISGQFDCVLINPPYTRSHRISNETKQHIAHLQQRVKNYATGRAGLHFWAVLGLDQMLTSNGEAVVVLPRAVINASYSQALKEHILDKFSEIDFYEYKEMKAFSQGSDLKELILRLKIHGTSRVSFRQIDHKEYTVQQQAVISPEEIQEEWNWGIYFLDPEAVKLGKAIQKKMKLTNRQGIDLEITRGIEMYGPNIFFFPNRNWDIKSSNSDIVISNGEKHFTLPGTYTETILRKPRLYKTSIEPNVNHVVLVINEDIQFDALPDNLQQYLNYIKQEASSARNRFGEDWFRHPSLQLTRKNPRGHIFIIDKLDIESTPTLAYYTENTLACTKNFYLLRLQSQDKIPEKILAAWLNSTMYFLLYLLHRREIGEGYGRMQIIDYDYHKLFPPLSNIEFEDLGTQLVLIKFDKIKNMDRGMLPDQLFEKQQIELDQSLISLFNLDIDIQKLHLVTQKLLNTRIDN